MPHIPISPCIHETAMSVYMPHMNLLQSTMWPGTLVYIISNYWHMSLNKYACHSTHIPLHCMPYLPQIFMILSQRPCVQGITMWPLVLTSLVGGWEPVVSWLLSPWEGSLEGLLSLLSTLSKAYLGYLHWVSAFLRWIFSLWRRSGLLHTVCTL